MKRFLVALLLVNELADGATISGSPQTIVQSIRSVIHHKLAIQLYRQQQQQTIESLQQVASLVNFSFILRGMSPGQASGDFIDVTQLADNRLLVRFGDVMGHDRQAAELAITLQTMFRDPTIASLLANRYRQQNGLIESLALLEMLVQEVSDKTYRFYTMTSTIIDFDRATLTSLFAGSGEFYLVRSTADGISVQELYDSTATTTFVSLDTSIASATDNADNIVPLDSHYQQGDVLVYLSDGLLERHIGNERLDSHPLLKQLIADCLNECTNFAKFAELLFKKITSHTDNPMPDDSSILALQLLAPKKPRHSRD